MRSRSVLGLTVLFLMLAAGPVMPLVAQGSSAGELGIVGSFSRGSASVPTVTPAPMRVADVQRTYLPLTRRLDTTPAGAWQCYESHVLCLHADDLYSVSMVSADEGWAVGRSGTILHYVGGKWQVAASPIGYGLNTYINSVSMVSASEGWAVGTAGWQAGYPLGTILHYSGGQWQEVASPTGHPLNSVSMVSAEEAWAVGFSGTIVHYVGGAVAGSRQPNCEFAQPSVDGVGI